MKKIISAVLVCVIVFTCVFALASCGKTVSGKYELNVGLQKTTYEFSGKNVTVTTVTSIPNIFTGETKEETTEKTGKYEINEEDGKLKITFTFEADGKTVTSTEAFVEGEENGKKYIKIGLIQYNKVD